MAVGRAFHRPPQLAAIGKNVRTATGVGSAALATGGVAPVEIGIFVNE